MLNYWWVTRPKRKLDSIPDILSCFAEVSLNCEWQGNVYTHLAFEDALEQHGLKRVGERKDQRGGGGRTYYAWLSSLGLIYKQSLTGQSLLTEAGKAIVERKDCEKILSSQVLKYQFPSPFSLSPQSTKTRVHERFRIRPFRFLLKTLTDVRIGYRLSYEEIARVIAVHAYDESDTVYEDVISRILGYREDGVASLEDCFFTKYAPSSGKVNITHPYSHLDDLANTLVNWLQYTQLIGRDNTGIWIKDTKREDVYLILSDDTPLIECAENQELFQIYYGSVERKNNQDKSICSTY